MYNFNQFYIPERMMEGLRAYINDHRPPGSFLRAVLENDLHGAVNRADAENLANLPAYIGYLHWEAPPACFGSPERVAAWLSQ